MKLDTLKITDGVAIHCPKKEYVRPLFEAMGWRNIETGERYWENYKENTCYTPDKGWHYSDREWYQSNGYTIIPFTDLVIEEENKLIKLFHAAGVGDWLQEGTEFLYRGQRCKVTGDTVVYWDEVLHCFKEAFNKVNTIITILFNPELIKPLPKWTPEEQEMAKKDSFRFKYVARDDDAESRILLYEDKPSRQESEDVISCNYDCDSGFLEIDEADYPSLKPGECVSLKEIAGGGE